ncbi:hypothetical protein WICMUC_002259 [Wickerhamomyces mucosus]|uniref:Transcription initiation factor TFIID subunit 13 n=1 Tax=Wickerhamomyces mucosus TaxID=1378264 RepID=A0A9P8TDX1_9ASCO|nr:hypothetical protein WICMUC_002259 [Wickerhamomyces mucosus]
MSTKKKKSQRQFTKDIENLLYAYGDIETPELDTINALEDILLTYVTDLCHSASLYSKTTRRAKIKVDDFKFVLRNDPIKLNRIGELLLLHKEIADAKKQFDDKEGKSFDKISNLDDDIDGNDNNSIYNNSNTTNNSNIRENSNNDNNKNNNNKNQEIKPKRKYTKTGKERKPYKKRAKKSDILAAAATAATPTPTTNP